MNKKLDEKNILYEGEVKVLEYNGNAKMIISNEGIRFERNKGLFKKKLVAIDNIDYSNIKIINGKVQAISDKELLTIYTYNKKYTLSCYSNVESKRLASIITDAKMGAKFFDRRLKNIEGVTDTANNVLNVVKKASPIILFAASIFSNVKNRLKK